MVTAFHHYILNGHDIEATDLYTWAAWYETADRRVAGDEIGPYFVSTVFLGIDHSFSLSPVPVLFETMVFEQGEERLTWRYCTWAEAEEGHGIIMAGLRQGFTLTAIEEGLQK